LTDEEYEEIKERERNLEKAKDDILVYIGNVKIIFYKLIVTERTYGS